VRPMTGMTGACGEVHAAFHRPVYCRSRNLRL